MDVKGKRVLVAGMGKSGVACAKLLIEEGATVIINDNKTTEKLPNVIEELKGLNYINKLGCDPMDLTDVDLVVLSPVISIEKPFAVKAKSNGAEIIGEIELGFRFSKAPIVCITGTNGKTTTSYLTGEIFNAGGRNTFLLGNMGLPIAEKARETTDTDIIVAEVAGFQLESTIDYHTVAVAFLNISEDHLDRFITMDKYIASKCMAFKNQTEKDFCVLNEDDAIVRELYKKTKAQPLFFSRLKEIENGAFVRGGRIKYRFKGIEDDICAADEIKIPGEHNLENALAAVCLARCQGIEAEAVAKALKCFEGVEHRIEYVKTVDKVRYINDSKGTNPDSTIKAVQAMAAPTVLLMGGSNKNSDYTGVFEAFNGKIKAVVALGETAGQILRDSEKTGYKNVYHCEGNFSQAVEMARSLSQEGDNVLLSPACASYDMFDNYEQRGRYFKELVNKM